MSANLKCYDALSGKTTFDMTTRTTRLLGIIGGDNTKGAIVINTGGGTPFWTLASGGAWVYGQQTSNGYFVISNDTSANVKITISESLITFEKPKGVVIIYGVYI